MAKRKIRVLVVDDSAVIRQIICDNISKTDDMIVAGAAADGMQALEQLEKAMPDVITLDVQMPKMDGLATLSAILERRAVPVVMCSSLTRLGASITLEALEQGAIDYVAKPDYGPATKAALGDELMRKVRIAAGTDVRRILEIRRQRKLRRVETPAAPPPPKQVSDEGTADFADKCIALGISTGGPPALSLLFQHLRLPMPPIVVVQHMPPSFTKPLAWRLDSLSALSIKEAEAGDQLRPNHVYIAPGGHHLVLAPLGRSARCVIDDGPPVSSHKPSVDMMMRSAAKIFGNRVLGVIMTGMGRDGADGCKAIRQAGGYVLGQDEATSDVYGMNKVAYVEGGVDRQFALADGPKTITAQVQKLWRAAAAVV